MTIKKFRYHVYTRFRTLDYFISDFASRLIVPRYSDNQTPTSHLESNALTNSVLRKAHVSGPLRSTLRQIKSLLSFRSHRFGASKLTIFALNALFPIN